MHGRGDREQLKLGGKTPNLQSSVLRFRLTKDLLKDCKSKCHKNCCKMNKEQIYYSQIFMIFTVI